MTQAPIDPDVTRHDDPAYWAAALVLAIRAGDKTRAETARRELRRCGYTINPASKKGKAVRDAR